MGYSSNKQFEGPYGVAHGDETFLQFQPYYKMNLKLNQADISVSNKLIELWKNFVKSGNASTSGIFRTITSIKMFFFINCRLLESSPCLFF